MKAYYAERYGFFWKFIEGKYASAVAAANAASILGNPGWVRWSEGTPIGSWERYNSKKEVAFLATNKDEAKKALGMLKKEADKEMNLRRLAQLNPYEPVIDRAKKFISAFIRAKEEMAAVLAEKCSPSQTISDIAHHLERLAHRAAEAEVGEKIIALTEGSKTQEEVASGIKKIMEGIRARGIPYNRTTAPFDFTAAIEHYRGFVKALAELEMIMQTSVAARLDAAALVAERERKQKEEK